MLFITVFDENENIIDLFKKNAICPLPFIKRKSQLILLSFLRATIPDLHTAVYR